MTPARSSILLEQSLWAASDLDGIKINNQKRAVREGYDMAIFRRQAPYRCVGNSVIFSSIKIFSSSVTQNFIWIFRFLLAMFASMLLGLGYPKIRKWVLSCCACCCFCDF